MIRNLLIDKTYLGVCDAGHKWLLQRVRFERVHAARIVGEAVESRTLDESQFNAMFQTFWCLPGENDKLSESERVVWSVPMGSTGAGGR